MLLVGIMLTDIVKGDDHPTKPATDQVFVDANQWKPSIFVITQHADCARLIGDI
jgi:hypothetical protein